MTRWPVNVGGACRSWISTCARNVLTLVPERIQFSSATMLCDWLKSFRSSLPSEMQAAVERAHRLLGRVVAVEIVGVAHVHVVRVVQAVIDRPSKLLRRSFFANVPFSSDANGLLAGSDDDAPPCSRRGLRTP